jgi:taurine dioxygenase
MLTTQIEFERISETFVAQVYGINLAEVQDAETIAVLREGLNEHGILVFRDQSLTNAEHVRFSQQFGQSEIHTVKQYLLPDFPEIIALANRGEEGTKPIANGGAYWHSDITYKARPPMASLLYALEVPPEGGDTLYCDMLSSYRDLDATVRSRIDGLNAVHGYLNRFLASRRIDDSFEQAAFTLSEQQKAELAEVVHPVVRTHPETGRRALFVNEGFTLRIDGMADAESQALLDELYAHATQPRHLYRHEWRVGDAVFWDNRVTMHKATHYDRRYARRMHRTTVQGDVPFF